jgi:hypothetical protein
MALTARSEALRQTRHERLRFGNLGHFRSRRKAFERRRENRVGVKRAAGQLVEFGEREGRVQLVAARALLLRNGDGGLEGLFGGRAVGGITFEQEVAAKAMEEGVR